MILAFVLGLVCGFTGSVPIAGPVAVLVVERGLDGKTREGLAIAIGAGVAESFYAGAAFLGMTAVIGRFPWMLPVSRVLGAIILISLGLYFALRKARPKRGNNETSAKQSRRGGPLVLGFVVTIVNPTLLVTWSAVVTILHSMAPLHSVLVDAVPFGIGAFSGIAGWFSILLGLLRKFRDKVKDSTLDKVVRGIGWALVAGGIGVAIRVALTWKRG